MQIKRRHLTSYAEAILFRHVRNKGLIKIQTSASILLHGDPNDKFQLELEEFIFRRLILHVMLVNIALLY